MHRTSWDGKGPELTSAAVITVVAGFAVLLLAGVSSRLAALVCGALLLGVALLAVLGWHRARDRAARATAAADQAVEERRADRERMERHVRRVEAARGHETDVLRQLRQAVKAEREWNRELRTQIQRLHAGRGMLDERTDDVHALVLRAAIELVQAEKGLLISRSDADADGDLDVVLARGFDRDPEHSAVAQRFARAVLARDEIIREDHPRRPADTEATPADREIDSLVAIPVYLRDRFHGVIVCANRPGGFEDVGDELLLALGDHAGSALHHHRLQHELDDAHLSSVRLLAEAVSAHDPLLHRETCELAMHAGLLAQDLGLDQRQRDVLVCATLLRAVGYLPLPERPRLNPGPLAPDERALVELHPRLGFDILARAPALHDVATAVLYHHERFDGTGYPAGLAGTDIPLPARVLAVLEAYGAMTHERPYRTPWPDEQACQELVAGAATQFDPEIAERFVEQVRRAPRVTRDDVAAAVVDAMPLEPLGAGLDGTFVAAAVDGPTLLGNHRALQHDIAAAARHGTPFGLVLVELSELAHINAASGFAAGDQVIDHAARGTRRAAARLGGTAYRLSGRRLAIVVPARDGHVPSNTLDEVHAEFLAGPAMHATMAAWSPGEEGDVVLNRARDALRDNAA